MTPEDLHSWRLIYNISQAQLAAALDVEVTTVSRWERGLQRIPGMVPLALKSLAADLLSSPGSPPSVGSPRRVTARPATPGRPGRVGKPAPAS